MEAKVQGFDPLDMSNYKIEKLPKLQKSTFEKWMEHCPKFCVNDNA